MRVLFLAYCMINNENGDSLIGVYKRSLRVGLELARRRHDVWVHCTGRDDFRDALTARAERDLHFLDFSRDALLIAPLETRRRYYRRILRRLHPDIVVAGEVPLAGPLLDVTLAAIGLGQRVVVLDNAYNPDLAELFVETHGPFADGIVLTGLSTFHPRDRPGFYCAVPPYVPDLQADAASHTSGVPIDGRRLIVVLGYERKAAQLALSLLPRLQLTGYTTVFVSPDGEAELEGLTTLPDDIRRTIHVVHRPNDQVLFSLIARSSLVIGKCGFMQVSEALALGVPFIGVYYRGCFCPSLLEPRAQSFVHATSTPEADEETVAAARRLLHVDRRSLDALHDGRFSAAEMAAAFIEQLPAIPRHEISEEAARLGYGHQMVFEAIQAMHPFERIEFMSGVRANRLRVIDSGMLDSVTCVYETEGVRRQAFLWGRRYLVPQLRRRFAAAASRNGSHRRVLAWSKDGCTSLEPDRGEEHLPELNIP